MKQRELEQLIWQTRIDALNYMTKQEWKARCSKEAEILNENFFKELENFGIKTELEYQLAVENADLKKEIELLKETIKHLSK